MILTHDNVHPRGEINLARGRKSFIILYSNRSKRGVRMKHFEESNTIQVGQFKRNSKRKKKPSRIASTL
jgi:hypothetical protein